METLAGAAHALTSLQTAHRGCTRCVAAGYLQAAFPVFSGRPGQRVLLVGQAPGPVETDQGRPFAGRAGHQLMRWLQRGGFASEDEVRERVYITAMTTCFPGRNRDNSGDRRPSAREVALCAPWLNGVLELLQPRLIIPVGSLAMSRFLPQMRLDHAVGAAFTPGGMRLAGRPERAPVLLPLPHPSGQSRWLNDPARMMLLDQALGVLRELLPWAV